MISKIANKTTNTALRIDQEETEGEQDMRRISKTGKRILTIVLVACIIVAQYVLPAGAESVTPNAGRNTTAAQVPISESAVSYKLALTDKYTRSGYTPLLTASGSSMNEVPRWKITSNEGFSATVFCVEFGKTATAGDNMNLTYAGNVYTNKDLRDKLYAAAYYGYYNKPSQYHDLYHYSNTSVYIWEILGVNFSKNGVNGYADEKKIMESAVNNFMMAPSFNNKSYEVAAGSYIDIPDTNGVLSHYVQANTVTADNKLQAVALPTGITISKNGNMLRISASSSAKSGDVKLERRLRPHGSFTYANALYFDNATSSRQDASTLEGQAIREALVKITVKSATVVTPTKAPTPTPTKAPTPTPIKTPTPTPTKAPTPTPTKAPTPTPVPVELRVVKFDANGGTGIMEDQIFVAGVSQNIKLNTFTKANSRFRGWALTPTSSVLYADGQPLTPNASRTLYAMWLTVSVTTPTPTKVPTPTPTKAPTPTPVKAPTPTPTKAPTPTPVKTTAPTPVPDNVRVVSFNANGGTGTMADQIFVPGVPQNLRANTFTRAGYEFRGWAISATGSSVYPDKQSFTPSANRTLYAVWLNTNEGGNFQLKKDAYNFANLRSSFGYSNSYKIPMERYIEVVGSINANAAYDPYAWSGSCFGFAATTGLFYTGNMNESKYGANTVYGIPAPGNPTSEVTLMMERYQISQSIYNVSRAKRDSIADANVLTKLVAAVKAFQETGEKPIIMSARSNGSGHAVVPYMIESQSGTSYTILVYDNNYPGVPEKLTLDTAAKTWNYSYYSSKGSDPSLSFIYAELVGANMGHVVDNSSTLLNVSTDKAMIYNSKGVSIDNIEDAVPVQFDDGQVRNNLVYYAPKDTYNVVPMKTSSAAGMMAMDSDEPFKVGISDGETYVSLTNEKPFETTIALGNKPAVEIKGAEGEFSMSVTTISDVVKTDNVAVYKAKYEDKMIVSLTGEVPSNSTLIGHMKDVGSTDSDEATTMELIFNTEEVGDKTTPKPESTPTPEPKKDYFEDVKSSDWFYKDVEYCAELGLVLGDGKKFMPNEQMSRGQFITILGRMEGIDKDEYADRWEFIDVSKKAYYAPYVAWGKEKGLVNGKGNKRFAPNDIITREEMATFIGRYMRYKEISLEDAAKLTEQFKDADKIADFAKIDVELMRKSGLLVGDKGYMMPKKTLTRAEGVTVFARLHKALKVK